MIRLAALLALLAVAPPEEGVRVVRDRWGVPYIAAPTWRAAFRAEGYVEAQDRWAQMDTFRRAAKGEAAEVHGPGALPNDRDRRRRGYTEAELRGMFEAGGERFRAVVTAYAAGVNDYLATRPEPRPRPWSETDSLAIGILMARRFGEAGDQELTVARVHGEMEKRLGKEDAGKLVDDLLRPADPSAPTTLHDHLREAPPAPDEQGRRRAPGLGDEAWAAYRAELDAIAGAREALGVPSYFGSNAWVASPKKSASGRALLYAGPMMGFNAPSICNEIHLSSDDGLRAAGMSFPGVPGVMIGWNASLAWTTTSGGADLVDVFVLELNPENPEQYRHKGAWRDFEVVEHAVAVKGAPAETLRVRRWAHGPLAAEPDPKTMRAHGLRMSFWMKEAATFEAVMDMNFAGTLEAFEAAARKVVTSHNFFCATADGRIGFWYCGAHPVRAENHDPRFPQAGDGSLDWVGILDPVRWPRAVDPPHGFFANWNNKPARDWEPGGFGKIFWGKKIIDVLEAEEKLTAERFGEIARLTAYHAYLADYFKPHFLAAAKGADDPAVVRAAEILAAWDHMEREGEAAPVVFERALRGLVQRVFGKFVDPFLLATKDVQRYVVDPLLYVLEGERAPVKLKFDYLQGRDLSDMLRSALKDAMRGGEEKLAWKEPSVDFKGHVGPVKSKSGRGTWQAVVEMGPDGPRAFSICAPGQSEDPASPHAKDQLELFERWAYKPFAW